MLALVHSVPGRLRFRAPALQTDPDRARDLRRQTSEIPGITDIRVNRVTGSVVVRYDHSRVSAETIIAHFASPRQPGHCAQDLLDPLFDLVVQRLLTSAAGAVISAFL